MLFATFDCPVIVPSIGWFPEIFEEFRIGILYEPSEPNALLNALKFSQTMAGSCSETKL